MKSDFELVPVTDAATAGVASELIAEYIHWLVPNAARACGLALDAQSLLASRFAPTDRVWVARRGDTWVGVGGLKQVGNSVAEIQRMYVGPAARGLGAGRRLLERLLSDAHACGVTTIRLESLAFLREAHALYRSAGFTDVPPWPDGSMERMQGAAQAGAYRGHAVFMELRLSPPPDA